MGDSLSDLPEEVEQGENWRQPLAQRAHIHYHWELGPQNYNGDGLLNPKP